MSPPPRSNNSAAMHRVLPNRRPQQTVRNRHENGTGGWIFAGHELAVLFPPDVSPTGIFNHPITRGKRGVLT